MLALLGVVARVGTIVQSQDRVGKNVLMEVAFLLLDNVSYTLMNLLELDRMVVCKVLSWQVTMVRTEESARVVEAIAGTKVGGYVMVTMMMLKLVVYLGRMDV